MKLEHHHALPRLPSEPVVLPTTTRRIALGLFAIACGWAGLVVWAFVDFRYGHFLMAVAFALLQIWPLAALGSWLSQRRLYALLGRIPEQVAVEVGPDGGLVAIVRFNDGGVATLALPDDYDPREDHGRFLLQQLIEGADGATVREDGRRDP